MDKIDQGIEAIEIIEAEIDTLMRRLSEVDPDALLRIEKLVKKFKIEIEGHCH